MGYKSHEKTIIEKPDARPLPCDWSGTIRLSWAKISRFSGRNWKPRKPCQQKFPSKYLFIVLCL